MADLTVDRMSLRLAGLDPARGEALARSVTHGLAGASPDGAGDIPGLRVHLRAMPGESDEALAGRIVAEILRQLQRNG